ncbi:hypothetical protein MBTS_21740 [Methylobacterium bullatum]|nr:hypothetical protein [Methylobacterium bullatum]
MCDTVQMTPVCICVREIDAASEITDTTVISRVETAINALEASCSTPAERVLALERVYETFARRRRSKAQVPFGRFIAHHLDIRQNRILMRA